MKSENLSVLFTGILILLLGVVIRYIIGKRRFKRRAIGGMQLFKNYNMSLIIRFIEGLGIIISFFIILGGIALIILYFLNN